MNIFNAVQVKLRSVSMYINNLAANAQPNNDLRMTRLVKYILGVK